MDKNNRIRLNKEAVQSLDIPASGRKYAYDTKTPGLAVCVTASKRKTFYLVKKVNGRPIRYRLGRCDEITVEQARKSATEKLADIARGEDPQKIRQLARKGLSMKKVLKEWIRYAKSHKKSWKGDEFTIEKFLRKWENRRLEDISRRDVTRLHSEIGKNNGHYMANRTLALLSAMINRAKTELKWLGENPCLGVKPFKEESRDRFLRPDELPRLLKALNEEPAALRDFFMLCLLTGARRSNVAAMQWREIQGDFWRIPETKGGTAVLVPLVPEALAVIKNRREAVDEDCPWVFPSRRSKTGHLVEPKSAWKRVCKRAKLEDLRIHDLRRTLGSWLAMDGASLPIIGKALGHGENSKATAVYARLMLDPVRRQLEQTTASIMATANGSTEEGKSESEEDAAEADV
jgi:integrase